MNLNCDSISVLLLTGVSHLVSFNRSQGAYRLASELRSKGVGARVIDGVGSLTLDQLKLMLRAIFDRNQDIKLVGISTSFFANLDTRIHQDTLVTEDYLPYGYDTWISLIEYIKSNTNAKIVVGGHKAHRFETDLAMHPYIDHILYGYSDVSIVELLNHQNSPKVITDLYPKQKFNFSNLVNHYDTRDSFLNGESFTIEMQRGCVYRCKFCAYPLNGKKKSTWMRDIMCLVDELQFCENNFGSKNFILNSDTFNDNYLYLKEFKAELARRNLKYNFAINARIDLFDEQKMIDLMPEIGVRTVLFGLESSNKNVMHGISKFFDFDKADLLLRKCKKSWSDQIKITGSYILGLPFDTVENIQSISEYFEGSNCPMDSIEFDPLFVTNPAVDKNPWKSEFTINNKKHGFFFKNGSLLEWENQQTPYLNYKNTVSATQHFNTQLSKKKANSIKSAAYTHLPNNFGHSLDARCKFEEVFKCVTYDDYKLLLKDKYNTNIEDSKKNTLNAYVEKFLIMNSE